MATIAQKVIECGEEAVLRRNNLYEELVYENKRQALLCSIELGLELKFGEEGLRLFSQVQQIDSTKLLSAIRASIKVVDDLSELRGIYLQDPVTKAKSKSLPDLMSRQKAVHDFLHHHLLKEIERLLDLSTLEIKQDSFVLASEQELFSDILWQVNLRDGQEAFIYLLIQHKNCSHEQLLLNLLRVRAKIKSSRQEKPHKPIVIPIVFYHDEAQQKSPLILGTLFNNLPEFLFFTVSDCLGFLRGSTSESPFESESHALSEVGFLLTLREYPWESLPPWID